MERAKNICSTIAQQNSETYDDIKNAQAKIALLGLGDFSSWDRKALCRASRVPDLFISDNKSDILQAKKYCKVCEVGQACLEAAMREEVDSIGGRYTVRGGLSGEERIILARRSQASRRRANIGNPGDR